MSAGEFRAMVELKRGLMRWQIAQNCLQVLHLVVQIGSTPATKYEIKLYIRICGDWIKIHLSRSQFKLLLRDLSNFGYSSLELDVV